MEEESLNFVHDNTRVLTRFLGIMEVCERLNALDTAFPRPSKPVPLEML